MATLSGRDDELLTFDDVPSLGSGVQWADMYEESGENPAEAGDTGARRQTVQAQGDDEVDMCTPFMLDTSGLTPSPNRTHEGMTRYGVDRPDERPVDHKDECQGSWIRAKETHQSSEWTTVRRPPRRSKDSRDAKRRQSRTKGHR